MQRPVMNPTFYDDAPAPRGERWRLARSAGRAIWRALRLVMRLITYDPFAHMAGFRVEEGTPASRVVRSLLYRLAFIPIVLAAIACAIVWAGTHPVSLVPESDPAWQGIYYEPVNFVGAEQVPLEGWLVPAIDARTVLKEKDGALRKKHPAVVLVHDQGQRREQMMPFIKPLHDAGFVVLAINLRGGGPKATVGETFGLREAGDVRAAIDTLRRRSFVDPEKVAVIGCGSGATAALIVAQSDTRLAAVVAEAPLIDVAAMMQSRMMPQSAALRLLTPLCKWTFEIAYGVDAEEIELPQLRNLRETLPALIEADNQPCDPTDSRTVRRATQFLSQSLLKSSGVAHID